MTRGCEIRTRPSTKSAHAYLLKLTISRGEKMLYSHDSVLFPRGSLCMYEYEAACVCHTFRNTLLKRSAHLVYLS